MNALEAFRVESKLSFQALADKLGVDKGRAHQWCRDVRRLTAERAVAVETATGIPRALLRPDLFGPPAPKDSERAA